MQTDFYLLSKISINDAKKAELKDCVSGKEGKKKTIFCAAYNDNGITFRFECEDDDIYADITEFNGNLFKQDVVEVFVSTDGDLAKYTEIEVSPLENILQLKVENRNLKGKIKTKYLQEDLIKRKVTMTKSGWDCEFFVPFSVFGSNDISRPWKFNAYRIDRAGKRRFDHYALNPTFKPKFHRPKYFIDLEFEK